MRNFQLVWVAISLALCGCSSYDVVTTNVDDVSRTEKVDKRTGVATHLFVPGAGWKSYKEIREAIRSQPSNTDCRKIERPCRPGDPEYRDYGDMNDLAAKYVKCYDYVGNCSESDKKS